MAAGKEYAVVLALRASNAATGPIRQVAGALAAIRGQVAAFGRENLGTGRIVDAVAGLRGAVGGVAGHIRGMLAPAMAAIGIGGGGAAAGLWAMARSAADSLDALNDMSARTGVTAQTLRDMEFAAKRAGAAPGVLESGINKLNKSIGDALNGNKEAANLFGALGIKLKDSGGNVYSAAAIMGDLADSMAKIENPAERAAVASALLGKSAGVELIPMLAGGSAQLNKWYVEAQKFGRVTQQQIEAAGGFNDSLDDLGDSTRSASMTIGGRLFPLITPLVKKITDWVNVNRDLVAGRIEQFAARFAAAADRIDIGRVVDGVFDFVEGVLKAVDAVGGWGMALGGVALVMASGPLLSTLQLVAAVVKLGFAIGVTAAKWAILAGGGVVGMIMSFVSALRTGVGVVRALNIAMAANPVGAIIVGITALVALGVTLYNTWKPFRDMIDWIVAKVAALAKGAAGWLSKKLGFSVGGGDDEGKGDGGGGGPGDAPPPAVPPVDAAAPPSQAAIAPPVVTSNRAEILLKVDAPVPVQVESVKQQGAGLTVRTDVPTGRSRVGTS